ncbi:flavodoxin [Neobacillus drentensis]|uniref:flavodoxin n=1 Tax=Neobacillus drentensis TaxID=220684 RepID=UPI001F3DEBA8|nr:flavodoxin [Neobacillus drentensis]ULT54407.1 flavodoxin [Neobacillus drentensis]
MDTIIVYASMTGTTELIARSIAGELARADWHVTVKDAVDTFAEELLAYDCILIGSYTWGDGELADEIICFHDELLAVPLSGKIAAAFGAGDSSYEQFGRAVNLLEETLENKGCQVIKPGLKVDGGSEEEIKTISFSFAKKINELTKPYDSE